MPDAARWVCFDVGETLIDETRVWATWAEVLCVTPFSMMAALGAVIARGEDHRKAFDLVDRPNWAQQRHEFEQRYGGFQTRDLYPDAVPSLDSLHQAGYRLAVIANQPRQRTQELTALSLRFDVMAMSEELGVHKPEPEFYAVALKLMNAQPSHVVYVGDRLDNDVRPAHAAGMHTAWLRRGPWGLIVRDAPPAHTIVVDSLTELVAGIEEIWP